VGKAYESAFDHRVVGGQALHVDADPHSCIRSTAVNRDADHDDRGYVNNVSRVSPAIEVDVSIKEVIDAWRIDYNEDPPHRTLRQRTPRAVLASWEPLEKAAD
jgi:hypothetical protein